jgi:hypothetical protein
MQGFTWNYGTFRKYIVAFGLLFNKMQIIRTDADGIDQLIKVPLMYGPRDKLLAAASRVFDSETESIATVTPRMSFEMKAPYFDAERKLNSLNLIRPDPTKSASQYNSVPYNFPFELAILVKNVEDGNQIVQQILPFFTPSLTVAIYPFDNNTAYSTDIPIHIETVEYQDQYEGDFSTRRTTMWVLQFTLKGYVFGPTRADGKVIQQVIVNFDPSNEGIIISPGLTITGQPTTDKTLTIPYQSIKADDDYGFIVEYVNT